MCHRRRLTHSKSVWLFLALISFDVLLVLKAQDESAEGGGTDESPEGENTDGGDQQQESGENTEEQHGENDGSNANAESGQNEEQNPEESDEDKQKHEDDESADGDEEGGGGRGKGKAGRAKAGNGKGGKGGGNGEAKKNGKGGKGAGKQTSQSSSNAGPGHGEEQRPAPTVNPSVPGGSGTFPQPSAIAGGQQQQYPPTADPYYPPYPAPPSYYPYSQSPASPYGSPSYSSAGGAPYYPANAAGDTRSSAYYSDYRRPYDGYDDDDDNNDYPPYSTYDSGGYYGDNRRSRPETTADRFDFYDGGTNFGFGSASSRGGSSLPPVLNEYNFDPGHAQGRLPGATFVPAEERSHLRPVLYGSANRFRRSTSGIAGGGISEVPSPLRNVNPYLFPDPQSAGHKRVQNRRNGGRRTKRGAMLCFEPSPATRQSGNMDLWRYNLLNYSPNQFQRHFPYRTDTQIYGQDMWRRRKRRQPPQLPNRYGAGGDSNPSLICQPAKNNGYSGGGSRGIAGGASISGNAGGGGEERFPITAAADQRVNPDYGSGNGRKKGGEGREGGRGTATNTKRNGRGQRPRK